MEKDIKYNSSTTSNLNELKDTDDARPLIMEYHKCKKQLKSLSKISLISFL